MVNGFGKKSYLNIRYAFDRSCWSRLFLDSFIMFGEDDVFWVELWMNRLFKFILSLSSSSYSTNSKVKLVGKLKIQFSTNTKHNFLLYIESVLFGITDFKTKDSYFWSIMCFLPSFIFTQVKQCRTNRFFFFALFVMDVKTVFIQSQIPTTKRL